MKKEVVLVVAVVIVAALAAFAVIGNETAEENSSGTTDVDTSEENGETEIVLGTDVTVDGSNISTEAVSSVYQSYDGSGYMRINIVEAGTYIITGSIENAQIFVNAADNDEVVLVLNGVDISCDSAPAILVGNAYDPETAGDSGVTIRLADGTTNVINGSHTDDNDAALSSNVSLLIEGDGTLEIIADMEGIETCMHLTINGGTIVIASSEDAINANEDGVSHITINGGTIYADASGGSDGDGIDSNGYIFIQDGTIYAFSSGENSGLDSDLGTIINGGTVFATSKMNDGVSGASDQTYMEHSFSRTLSEGTLVYVLDGSGNSVVAFKVIGSCSSFLFSSSELSTSGTYGVYLGGAVSGTFDAYSVCYSFTVTSAGTLQASNA